MLCLEPVLTNRIDPTHFFAATSWPRQIRCEIPVYWRFDLNRKSVSCLTASVVCTYVYLCRFRLSGWRIYLMLLEVATTVPAEKHSAWAAWTRLPISNDLAIWLFAFLALLTFQKEWEKVKSKKVVEKLATQCRNNYTANRTRVVHINL